MNSGDMVMDMVYEVPDNGCMSTKTSSQTEKGGTMTLADEKYMALTTFRKDGTPKTVPVWPVEAGDGRVGFITSSKTWKAKRMANNPRVEVQPSDSRGRAKESTESITGTAQIFQGSEFNAINTKVASKYGYQLKIINFMHAIPGRRTGHRNDVAVVITLDPS